MFRSQLFLDYKNLGVLTACTITVNYWFGRTILKMATMTADVLTVENVLYYILLVAVGLFCLFQWRYRDLLRVAARLPVTYPTIPLLGHGYMMWWGLDAGTEFLLEMSTRAIEKGISTIGFWVGPLPLLLVHDYEDVRTIMNSAKTIDKSDEYQFFKEGLDTAVGPLECSMLLSPGPVWKLTRRHMNHMFTPRNLDQMIPVFNVNARVLVDRLKTKVGQGQTELNIVEFTMDAALKAICDFLFGIDNKIDIYSKEFQGLKHIVDGLTETFVKRTTQPWLRWYPLFYFFYKDTVDENNRLWKAFTANHLKLTKEQYEIKMRKSEKVELDDEREKPLNIVEVYRPFQEKNPQFTEADMWGEMLTLYETGSDSVAVTTSYCLLALAQYPEYQEKAYQEILSVVGPVDDVTSEHAKQLTYLTQCIKETLRRFTLVPYLLRRASDDLKLSDCTVPAGNTVIMSIYGVHMNPKIYPDPKRFDPERFSTENSASRDKFAFVPFSGGPRDCIGKEYGMLYAKVLLSNILRTFKVKQVVDVNKLRRRLAVVLVSGEGYKISLEPRSASGTEEVLS